MLAPRWRQVGPCWLMLAPSWPHDGPSSKVSPRLAKVSTKALPLRPRFSQMSTKALPQAFRRLIFRSGCSIVLFSNLKVVSFWVRLSNGPVMAGLSQRFIQTFLSSGSGRQLLLEVSAFFVHCTKALCRFPLFVRFWRFFLAALPGCVFQNENFKRSWW